MESAVIYEELTRKLMREPGWDGKRLILLRLMSRISKDGMTVNCHSRQQSIATATVTTYDIREYREVIVL